MYIAHEDHGERCAACSILVDIKNEIHGKHVEESLSARKLVQSGFMSDDETTPLEIPKTEESLTSTKGSINFEPEGFHIEFDSDYVIGDNFEG